MVQRKVCSELGIQADHVKFDKSVTNLKLAYSHHQDGKGIVIDGMKKMKKSNSTKLSDLEAFRSPSPRTRRSLFQSRKMLPLHVPNTAETSQKHKPLLKGSPNYMKPTKSSDAKEELLPVSHQNNQLGSYGKNLPQKCLSNSKSTSSVSNIKTAKTMSRSSSVNSVKTLNKTLSFKPSTTRPRKSTTKVFLADINAPYRATCSSTLKVSNFPAYLKRYPAGGEYEVALIAKVCPYTYCSLNGNCSVLLPQFNCIMSAKKHLLKTQKSIKMQASQRMKVPCKTRKYFDIEQIVLDGKPASNEIGVDFFNEINAKERGKAYKIGRSDAVKHHEDQEDIKFAMEDKNMSFDAQPRQTSSVQESASESIRTDYPSGSTNPEDELSYLGEEKFQHLTDTEDNDREIEKHIVNEASSALMALDEDTVDSIEGQKICVTHKLEESHGDSKTKLENNNKETRQRNQIPSFDVPEESTIIVDKHELLEEYKVTATKFQIISCIGDEERNIGNDRQWLAKNKRPIQYVQEMRKISPRKPNFMPLVPDPKPEKVELKHQMMDERKNAEEWMLDFSLRKAVTKIAPSKKKKVALLVEAFETVMSTPKGKPHERNNSSFAHARPIQACI